MNIIRCRFILRYFFILIIFIFFVNSNIEAAGELAQTFTLDGQLNQVGTEEPLLDANVKIVVQILNPAKTCLLYEEEQNVNTTNSKGNYTIQVGSLTSAGKRTTSDPGRTMVQIFQNSVPIAAANAPGQSCAGAVYTPASADSRNFRIIVTPSSTNIADTLQPDTVMDSVSMALVAQTLQGYVPSQFLQIGTGDLTQANIQTVFGTGNTAKLTSLLNNNPSDYVLKNSSNGTIQLPAASAPTSPSTGAIWYDSGAIKFWNGSSEQTLGVSGAGITNLTAGTGLNVGAGPGGSITTTGTLNVDVGTAVGKIVQVQAGGKLPALSAADLTAVNGSAITSGTIGGSTAVSTSGRIETSSSMRLYDGGPTNYVGLQAPASVTTSYSLTWPSAVPGVNGSLLTSNTSGGLSWTAPTSLSQWVTAGSDIYYTIGNVGIGTATPAEKLDISGNINFSGVGNAVIRRDNDTSPLDIYGGPTYSQGAKLSLYGENEAGNPGRAVVAYGGGTVGSLAQTNGYFQVFRRNSAGTQSVLLADMQGRIGIGTITPTVSLDIGSKTDAVRLPVGTTAQQPASPATGMIRWNSDNTVAEIYNGTGWVNLGTYSGSGTYANVNVISGGSGGLSVSAGGTNQNLTLSSSGTGTVTTGSPVTITNATASTASNNGALVVTGGVGISGALNTGGNIYSSGNITAATALYSPIIYGGTASSGDLTLDSTSHATKGNIFIAPSGGKVGIGTTSPITLLDIRPNLEGSTGVGFVNIQTSEGGTFFTAHQTGSTYSYSEGMFKAITENPTGANNVYFQGVTDNVTKFSVQADGQGYFAGKVGIGTAVPASTLDLNGDLSSRGMAAPALSVVGTGKIYFDSTANKFKVSQNGGAFAELVGGGGTVTDVTGSGAISSSGGATPAISIADSSYGTKGALSILTDATTSGLTIASGVLSINTGTAANQIVKLDGTGKLPSVDGSTLTNLTAANISSGTLPIARGGTNSSTALTNGKVMVSTGGAIVEGMASSTASSANTFVIRDGSGNINAAIGTFSGVNVNAGSNLTLNGSTSGSVVVASPDAPTSYTFTLPTDAGTSGQVLSTNGSGITSWVSAVTSTTGFINGGNSFGSAATFGTNDNFDLDIKTNNTSKVTIKSSGNVGIGTTTPGAKLHVVGSGSAAFPAVSGSTQSGLAARLQGTANNAILDIGGNTTNGAWLQSTNKNDLSANYPLLLNPNGGNIGIGTTSPGSGTKLNVAGQIVSGSASIATGAIDFSSGNAITTTDDCASPLTLANIQDGGSYTVVVTGTGTAQCSFSTTTTGDGVGTVTYRFNPSNTTRTASSHTVYSMMRVGSIVYVSWITGF